jgi:hypothetical protein
MTVREKKKGENKRSSTRVRTFFVGLRVQGVFVYPVWARFSLLGFPQRSELPGGDLGDLEDLKADRRSLTLDLNATSLKPCPSLPKKRDPFELEVLEMGDKGVSSLCLPGMSSLPEW